MIMMINSVTPNPMESFLRGELCLFQRRLLLCGFTDGIGTPDPNPRNLVNWCFYSNLSNITFF